MIEIEAIITLIHPGETKEEDEKAEVIATVESSGRDEFTAAGQKGFKATNKFTIWAVEYDGQKEVIFNSKRMTIYRTYGPRSDDRIELYSGERTGNR